MPPSPLPGGRLAVATTLAAITLPLAAASATPRSHPAAGVATPARLWLASGMSGRRMALPTPRDHARTRRDEAVRRRLARTQRRLRAMRAAGDRIARRPYVYGGGHGSFTASGYDCSGSVSYVLHAANLLAAPVASGGLEAYGRPGRGEHVTIYANAGHAFMVVDGRRFDTIAFQEAGTRWSSTIGATSGYVVRHPAGL